jgi:tetratricopeptide (TPR) repeat protein/predicted Ser/Thr protein kinase
MTMPQADCPDDETLAQFVAGAADADAARSLDAHVTTCPACYHVLSTYARTFAAAATASNHVSRSGARADDATVTADATLSSLRRRGALPPGTIVGRYVILAWVGEGGVGVVYAAYDPQLDRKVALKVMQPRAQPDEAERLQAMLSLEARAMAQLAHPNVAAVHDSGTYEGQAFIAMEFIEGPTLRSWIAESCPDRTRILEVFADAGRGLSAAHAAGLVHRDFKPENVLIGPMGRPRVTDFGLALVARGVETSSSSPDDRASPRWAGTPAYMAPEQRQGHGDARSDQFSFCVALYEALYGELPFGRDVAARSGSAAFPPAARVGPRLRRVLARGLSLDATKRYPSMHALLSDLQRAGRRPAWVPSSLAAAALVIAVASVAFPRPHPAPPVSSCTGAQQRLAGVWNQSRRDAIARALHATGKPFADDTWNTVAGTLDAYANAWTAERTDACEATRVRGEQSEAVLDRRMACFDQRLVELRALGDVLSRADESVVEKAAQATSGLVPLSSCSALSLSRSGTLPLDPTVADTLAQAKALRKTGQYADAERAAQSALESARAVDQPQAVAEVLSELGEIAIFRQDGPLSEKRYFDALEAATRLGGDALVAHAEERLGRATGLFQERTADALRWLTLADATLARLGDDADADRGQVLVARSHVLRKAGQSRAAAEECRRAIQFLQDRLPDDWRDLASAENTLGASLDELDEGTEEAAQALRLALRLFEHGLGAMHPSNVAVLNNLAHAEINLGHYGGAVADEQKALAIGEVSEVPGHLMARAWLNLSDAFSRNDRLEQGRAAIDKALEVAQASATTPARLFANLYDQRGTVERQQGRFEDAAVDLQHSLAILDRELGPHHPESVGPHADLGLLEVDRGRPLAAIPHLEEALSLAESRSDCVPCNFALAQALWVTGRDRSRARTLLKQEREYFRGHPDRAVEVRDRELWFQQHAPELRDE